MSNRILSREAFIRTKELEAARHSTGIKFFAFEHYLNKNKRRARWEENRRRRAALYAEMTGEKAGAKLAEWHTTLDALSAGTA